MSFDHKPDNTDERNRIEKAGGKVSLNRVNG
jgi:serine/threonine protein phosphatase PrpC